MTVPTAHQPSQQRGAWDVTSPRSRRSGPPGPRARSLCPPRDPFSTQTSSPASRLGLDAVRRALCWSEATRRRSRAKVKWETAGAARRATGGRAKMRQADRHRRRGTPAAYRRPRFAGGPGWAGSRLDRDGHGYLLGLHRRPVSLPGRNPEHPTTLPCQKPRTRPIKRNSQTVSIACRCPSCDWAEIWNRTRAV